MLKEGQRVVMVTEDSKYARLVVMASLSSIMMALLLVMAKMLVWFFSNSITILASMTDSMMDLVTSVINYIAVRFAIKPPDEDHNYGHAKIEALAGLAQCAFISASAIFLLVSSINRYFNPVQLMNIDLGIYVTVLSLILTLFVVVFQTYVIKKTDSQIIAADRLHCQSDLYSNLAIIVSLLICSTGYEIADVIFALLITVYIAHGVYGIGVRSLNVLLDKKISNHLINDITSIMLATPGVLGLHEMRTRRVGNYIYIQVHMCIDRNISLEEAHAIASTAQKAVLCKYSQADILIHMDPVNKTDLSD
ncbi:MAG: cation diffusion facilitator family transporter [Ruminobacter sp.]|jgi:ferrous-iron efflux pump FieF|uniref:Ferrous-iron efflux pump FieF n=1 Tax=Ruminobacter amylophilus TaxID=867 RepID=A0A662ZI86_9GAMM|nr:MULTISPECIES: cation diffusion facilitator family transporter [Ruminobacter]MBQ3775353.1 cation diffusion facilitator family transporter [Ruminobacter sp.]SFP46654.1 ferrous-iron efflux pump FieF [Ruminobacter amylophilus]